MSLIHLATRVGPDEHEVRFVSCKICGAALIVDASDSFNRVAIHNEWHVSQGRQIRAAHDAGDYTLRPLG